MSTPKKKATKKTDWRKAPRKPPEQKRSAMVGLRVTVAEREALNAAAREAGQTLVDFILSRCGVS